MSVDFYRELYDAEWIRRDEVRQAIGLPAGVLTLLAGALVFYAKTYSFPKGGMGVATALLLGGAVVAWLVAVYMLVRSLFGRRYRRIPWPAQILAYEEGLRSYYAGKAGGDAAASKEFDQFLIDRLVDAANRNSENNANAGEYLYKANRAMVVALILTAVAAWPVVLDLRRAQTPYRVETFNTRE